MSGWYDYRLVALSVLIAISASYASFDLAARITAARGRARLVWLGSGAVAMGVGIWSMHYVGMLAFHLPVPVLYDWPIVAVSLAAAVFAALVALFVVTRKQLSWSAGIVGGVVMGAGIATMHYTGMAAMRAHAACSYDPQLVILSVLFAIVISWAAIWLTFSLRGDVGRPFIAKLASAVVMGSAIPIMHYTGMAAAHFTPSTQLPDLSHALSTSTLGFAAVSAVTFLMLGAAIATAAVDRWLGAQRSEMQASERKYEALVQDVKDYAIYLLTPDGLVASWNSGAERIKGYKAEEILGKHFSCFYPPEDIADGVPARQLKIAREEGRSERSGWRVRKDGSRFWGDAVITALRDRDGNLLGFSKIVRDVTEQRRAEQNLRLLSVRLLEAQDEERRRVARELHDGTGQLIAALGMSLGSLEREHNNGSGTLSRLKEMREVVEELSREVRTVSYLLHPPLLDETGLVGALRPYVEGISQRSKVQVHLEVSPEFGRLSQDMETALFRIAQEALTNVLRHAESPTAIVRLIRNEDEVRLEVVDQGKGIPLAKQSTNGAGVGIAGMRERVRRLGGTLEITSGDNGTRVLVHFAKADKSEPLALDESASAVRNAPASQRPSGPTS